MFVFQICNIPCYIEALIPEEKNIWKQGTGTFYVDVVARKWGLNWSNI